jgi:hypothetical protein
MQWEDKSKTEKYKKSVLGFVLVPLVIVITTVIAIYDLDPEALTKPIGLVLIGILLVMIIGPVLTLRYKIKRDLKGDRLAYDNNRFLLISEKTNEVRRELNPNGIKAIFLDDDNCNCYIATTSSQLKVLEKTFTEYDTMINKYEHKYLVLAGNGPAKTTIGISEEIRKNRLFYKLSEDVIGVRMVDIRGLERFIDTISVFEKKECLKKDRLKFQIKFLPPPKGNYRVEYRKAR